MKCPKCNGKTGVIEVIHDEKANEQLRQRRCKSCGYKFWTSEVEVIETDHLKHVRYENHRSTRRKRKLKLEATRKEQQC